MTRVKHICLRAGVLLFTLFVPSMALAQSEIAGVVKDATGGVLPGVTVEASSAALIEKVRTAVTDGAGLYRLTDLRPGTYVVTFTLPGLGKLVLVNRKARIGRNPATGEQIQIPAKRVVKFRVAKAAKDAILGPKK